ncbi:MAG: hypothetical protein M3O82_03215 [Verrucomicrobiota bacterium]|nr:hypothetical protein [Verrucomicrobiota bacterium]
MLRGNRPSRLAPQLALVFLIASSVAGALAIDSPQPTGATFARTSPYSMIGQLRFVSGSDYYVGSGTAILPKAVLTAAHNLWDPQTGWSRRILFIRSKYDDAGLSRQLASRKYILGGYSSAALRYGGNSSYAFANDMGGLRFLNPLAGGLHAGWRADVPSLTGADYNIALGYGAETHSGDELLFVEPTQSFYVVIGGYLNNDSILAEGGMSGGPVMAPNPSDVLEVVGVVVSGSTDGAGIRAIDAKAARFIRANLR